MKHFITGGSGFFGLHLIDRLLKEGEEILVFDRTPLDESYQAKGVQYIQGDILDEQALENAMHGADIVHHNAAVLPVARAGKDYKKVNVDGTENVLKAALKNKVKKVLCISTSSVYGVPVEIPVTENTPLTPMGVYGWSKYDAEQVIKKFREEHHLDVSIIRPRCIIGTGRMGIFGILFDWVASGKKIYIIGKGDNPFQFLSADDLADACYLMTIKPCKNEDFIIGAKEFGTVKSDLDALLKHAGTGGRVVPTNAFLVRNVLRVVDWMKISPLVDWHYKTPDKPMYFSTEKAEKMLGWSPKDSNADMFKQTYDWYMQHKDELQSGVTHRKTAKQGILRLVKMFS